MSALQKVNRGEIILSLIVDDMSILFYAVFGIIAKLCNLLSYTIRVYFISHNPIKFWKLSFYFFHFFIDSIGIISFVKKMKSS